MAKVNSSSNHLEHFPDNALDDDRLKRQRPFKGKTVQRYKREGTKLRKLWKADLLLLVQAE